MKQKTLGHIIAGVAIIALFIIHWDVAIAVWLFGWGIKLEMSED